MYKELKTIIDTMGIVNYPIVAPKETPLPFSTININNTRTFECLSGFTNSKNTVNSVMINCFSERIEEAEQMKNDILGALTFYKPSNMYISLEDILSSFDGHYQFTILLTIRYEARISNDICQLFPSEILYPLETLYPCKF